MLQKRSSCVTKTGVTQKSASLKRSMFQSQSFFINTILTVSHQSFLSPDSMAIQQAGEQKHACVSLCAYWYGWSIKTWISQSSLKQCHWTQMRQMGEQTHCRHALATSFSAYAGVSSADWLAAVSGGTQFDALVVLLMLLCSFLGCDGPLGSSCFCAGLRQKPYVSSNNKHRRKP